MNGKVPGVVVFSGYTNALNAVRSLGMRGVPVNVVTTTRWDIAQHSKYCIDHVPLFELRSNPDALLEFLERHVQRWRGWALLPADDHSLEGLSRHHEQLSRNFRILAAPAPATDLLLDKDRFRQLAAEVGVEMPRYYGMADTSFAQRTDLQFPLIIKPTMTHKFIQIFKKKLLVISDRPSLEAALPRIKETGAACQVFDLVPGPDCNLYSYGVYIDRHGEATGGVYMRKLRQAPPFYGVTRVIETAHRTDLHEPTVEILRRAGYRGMACAEFKLDPRDGRLKLLEINGRMDLTFGLARAAGVNFAHLAWQDQALGQKVHAAPSGWQGVWIHLFSDLKHSWRNFHRENLNLRDYVHPYLRRKVFGVLSMDDPKPFVVQTQEGIAMVKGLLSGKKRSPGNPTPESAGHLKATCGEGAVQTTFRDPASA
jgi:predicted ATP-grasp superfamily ATP-dependent carboligase